MQCMRTRNKKEPRREQWVLKYKWIEKNFIEISVYEIYLITLSCARSNVNKQLFRRMCNGQTVVCVCDGVNMSANAKYRRNERRNKNEPQNHTVNTQIRRWLADWLVDRFLRHLLRCLSHSCPRISRYLVVPDDRYELCNIRAWATCAVHRFAY